MADSLTDGKPDRERIERQRVMMQDVNAALILLGHAIADAEEEGSRLAQQAAEFEQAERRGETPAPHDVARVVAAQAALVERCQKLTALMQTMGQQAEAVTHAANAVVFEALRCQFNAQFNIKEGL